MPELSFAKKDDQMAAAKVALFAYNRRTREPIWQSGISESRSIAADRWYFGAGPFHNGSIYSKKQSDPSLFGSDESDPTKSEYFVERRFADPTKSLADNPPDPKPAVAAATAAKPAVAAPAATTTPAVAVAPTAKPAAAATAPAATQTAATPAVATTTDDNACDRSCCSDCDADSGGRHDDESARDCAGAGRTGASRGTDGLCGSNRYGNADGQCGAGRARPPRPVPRRLLRRRRQPASRRRLPPVRRTVRALRQRPFPRSTRCRMASRSTERHRCPTVRPTGRFPTCFRFRFPSSKSWPRKGGLDFVSNRLVIMKG